MGILRFAASTVDSCFLLTQTSVLVALLLSGAGILVSEQSPQGCLFAWLMAGPVLVFTKVLLMLYSFYRAAMVTEKCLRAPALVNSMASEPDPGLQGVVQYMHNSSA